MKRTLPTLILLIFITVVLSSQGRGTPSTLRVKIDANGALLTSSTTQVNPVTTVTFGNARLRVDADGNLVTVGSGGGGGTDAADITAGTFPAGNFNFATGFLGFGTVNYSTPRALPTHGFNLQALNEQDFTIVGSQGGNVNRSITFRLHNSYTMIFAGEEDRQLYLSTPSVSLFHTISGTKTTFTGNENNNNSFQLGYDGFSEEGETHRMQVLQAFDGYRAIPFIFNQIGGHTKIAGGRATGTGTDGNIYFATAQRVAETNAQLHTHTNKAIISDALQLIATGLSKPTCAVGERFKLWPVAGGAGVADTFEVCLKDAADTYSWNTLSVPIAGSTPTCSGCGSNHIMAGNNGAFSVLIGDGDPTPADPIMVFTFGAAWPSAPRCTAASGTAGMSTQIFPATVVTTTTTVTIGIADDMEVPEEDNVYHVICSLGQ